MEQKVVQDNQYKAMMAEIDAHSSDDSSSSGSSQGHHHEHHIRRTQKTAAAGAREKTKCVRTPSGRKKTKPTVVRMIDEGHDDDDREHHSDHSSSSSSNSDAEDYNYRVAAESKQDLERQHDEEEFATTVPDESRVRPKTSTSSLASHQYPYFHRQNTSSHLHNISSIDIRSMKVFIHTPHRKGERAIRCYIERDKGKVGLGQPTYRLYIEEGRQFIMAAKKRSKNKTSNYLLSLEKHPKDCHSSFAVGKIRSNWSGSEYTIYDEGMNPKKTVVDIHGRHILGLVGFRYDKMGPGKLAGCIPRVNEGGVPLKLVDLCESSEITAAVTKESGKNDNRASPLKIWDQIDHGVDTEKLMVLRNKRPKFDPKANGHVLNFRGRVTMSSVKNFQLECDDTHDDTVLQFGRISCRPPGPTTQCECHADTFNMDFQYPLSPLQAFAFCIASLDKKMADTKGYEAMTTMRNHLKKKLTS